VDSDLAEQIIATEGSAADVSKIRSISGTKEWRKRFWSATLDSLEAENLWLTGHGYGFSLGTLIHEDVRTPHNFAIYLLGYTGCVGLALYAGFVLALFAAMRALPRGPFRLFLIGQLATTLIVASFGNGLETPFVAVPFYLVMGLAYGFARAGAGASHA
jgi:O-antigen ligase